MWQAFVSFRPLPQFVGVCVTNTIELQNRIHFGSNANLSIHLADTGSVSNPAYAIST